LSCGNLSSQLFFNFKGNNSMGRSISGIPLFDLGGLGIAETILNNVPNLAPHLDEPAFVNSTSRLELRLTVVIKGLSKTNAVYLETQTSLHAQQSGLSIGIAKTNTYPP
jgi:hypothetical protein